MHRSLALFLLISTVFLTTPRMSLACQFLNRQPADPLAAVPNTACALYSGNTLIHYDTYGGQFFYAKTDNVALSVQISPYSNPNQRFDCTFAQVDGAGNKYWTCECPASGAILFAYCDGAGATLGASQPWLACGARCGN